jgi:hypothetical protein
MKALVRRSLELDHVAEERVLHSTLPPTFRCCISAFRHLCRDIPGRHEHQSYAILTIIALFTTLIDSIHTLSRRMEHQELSTPKASVAPRTKNTLGAMTLLLVKLLTCEELLAFESAYSAIIEGKRPLSLS